MSELKPHRGTTILVFGILSFFICVIFGIVAWVMGNTDLKEMDAGIMDPSGRDMTNAGKICGIVSVILNILVLIGVILFTVLMIGSVSQMRMK